MELSAKYAKEHNLVIDDSLKLTDLGVSAFKGNNAVEGRLGAFLQAVDNGIVPAGSTLLVENLDRISREHAIDALALLNKILQRDITVVTLTDNQKYTKESIRDTGQLLYSIVVMARANEESELKSRRTKAAHDNRKRIARETKAPVSAIAPAWIELVNGQFVLKKDAAKTVQLIFNLYANGRGYHSLTNYLNEHKVETFTYFNRKAAMWGPSYIKKILHNPAVIGSWDNIDNFYPAAIDLALYKQVQDKLAVAGKHNSGRKGPVSNIFSNLCKCAKCGAPMILHTTQSYRSLMCYKGRYAKGDCKSKSWVLSQIEPLVLKQITELDIDALIGTQDDKLVVKQIENEIAQIEINLNKFKQRIKNNHEALEDSEDNEERKRFRERIKELVNDEKNASKTLEELKTELDRLLSRKRDTKQIQQQIIELQDRLIDNDVRIALNAALKRIINKIVIDVDTKTFIINYKSTKTKELLETGRVLTVSEEQTTADGTKYRVHSIP
jgi:hypothetical protein